MNNAEWMIKNGYKFSDIHFSIRSNGYLKNDEVTVCIKGQKIDTFESELDFTDETLKKWLDMEHKEPILDDAEKQYLSAVIKPFRNKVQNIAKYRTFGNTEEYIIIQIDSSARVYFPHFKADTMYKGMEICKKYTLEELGL